MASYQLSETARLILAWLDGHCEGSANVMVPGGLSELAAHLGTAAEKDVLAALYELSLVYIKHPGGEGRILAFWWEREPDGWLQIRRLGLGSPDVALLPNGVVKHKSPAA